MATLGVVCRRSSGESGWRRAFATLRTAVKALLGRGGTEISGACEWDPLIISSPCSGSIDRMAKPSCWSAADGSPVAWDGFCSVCKRPLSISSQEGSLGQKPAKRSRCGETDNGSYAYVTALWGSSPEYVLGALVLAWSLRKTGTKHDLVLLHTADVTNEAVNLLQRAGWKCHEIEHVQVSKAVSAEVCARFSHVFTKLRVLQLTKYSKILVMDIDLLVQSNIDDLFELEAPAAMVRGPEVRVKHGERVSGARFFLGSRSDAYSWGQASGINAGVMLLQPDENVFQQMIRELRDAHHPEHIRGNGPEQDYLSRFYAGDWSHINVAYNFQLHHVYFQLNPASSPTADRVTYMFNPDLIKIIHFSSEPKPWSRCLEDNYAAHTDAEWLSEVLHSFDGYRAFVLKDRELMKRQASRAGLILGPDGHLHEIDWARVQSQSKWKTSELQHKDGALGTGATGEGNEKPSVEALGLFSDDGWPLKEALIVSESAVTAAETAIQISQTAWFNAYKELSAYLGVSDLAVAVKSAATGPVIREDWDWNTYSSKEKSTGSLWTRDNTGGWWTEEPTTGRYVATCCSLPQVQACLMADSTALLTATCEGVHVVAVCPPCLDGLDPQSFTSGPDAADAARRWAESVPHGAMILLAVVDRVGGQVDGILQALVNSGLGCPSVMPSKFAVAAAVGTKGDTKWHTTHVATHLALARFCTVSERNGKPP